MWLCTHTYTKIVTFSPATSSLSSTLFLSYIHFFVLAVAVWHYLGLPVNLLHKVRAKVVFCV